MSRAAADKQEERAASFKEGLSAGRTDRRASDAAAIRKRKHEWKLSRVRGEYVSSGNAESDASQLDRMLSLYKPQQIVTGDAAQLRLLHDILQRATTPMLDAQLPALVNEKVVAVLVQHIAREDCAETLQALTGIVTRHELIVASFVIKGGFLAALAEEGNARRVILWDVLHNLLLGGGKGAAIEVMGSAFFKRGIFQAVAPTMPASSLLRILCNLIIELNDGDQPTWPLIEWAWTPIMHCLLNAVPSTEWLQLDEDQRIMLNCSLLSVNRIFLVLGLAKRADAMCKLLLEPNPLPVANPLIRKLQAILRSVSNAGTEVLVLEIMVRIAGIQRDNHDLTQMMSEAGCARDMVFHAARPDEMGRYYAFLWLGNYMADGTANVRQLLELDVMRLINEAIDRSKPELKDKAIYALMSAFESCRCDYEWEGSGAATRALANETMQCLVVGHHMYARLAEHLGLQGMEQISVNILRCMRAGLRWNREQVMKTLKVYRVKDRIEELVTELMASRETTLYEVAVEVCDLIKGRAPENREAALEAANAMMFPMDMGDSGFMGGKFDF